MEWRILVVTNFFLAPEFTQRRSIFDISPVGQRLEMGNKSGQLLLPVMQGRSGRNNEERTPNIMRFGEVCE